MLSSHYKAPRKPSSDTPQAKKQDVKNLIADKAISETLLTGATAPPLEQSVRASVTTTPDSDAEKSMRLTIALPYNHFLQVSVLIRTKETSLSRSSLLCYHRKPFSDALQHEHTEGWAAIWGASFERRLREPSMMDDWLDLCSRDQVSAESSFMSDRHPLLFELFRYKYLAMDRLDVRSIRPFGVITNDQRESHQRIYSAYIFEVIVKSKQLEGFAPSAVWEMDWNDGITNMAVAEQRFFDQKRHRSNAMDVLAWRALHTGQSHVHDYATARFIRGFEVV